jgi:hypothetical protein
MEKSMKNNQILSHNQKFYMILGQKYVLKNSMESYLEY